MMIRHNTRRFVLAALICASITACSDDEDDHDHDHDHDHDDEHGELSRLELALASTGRLLAAWTADDGWRDADGEALQALPAAVLSGNTAEPLKVGGEPASLEVRLVGGESVDIAPADDTGVGDDPCGEHSVRYYPVDDTTSVIAWPNVSHPDASDGPELFAERASGELVQIFFCNRLDIYPEQAGTTELEFVLWHVGHADQTTDALEVEVVAAE